MFNFDHVEAMTILIKTLFITTLLITDLLMTSLFTVDKKQICNVEFISVLSIFHYK